MTDNDPRYTIFAFGTGYLNVLGQAANLGCSAYLTADCIDFMVEEVNGHQFSPLETLLTYASELLQNLMEYCLSLPLQSRVPCHEFISNSSVLDKHCKCCRS